jgi:hypothetical protein
MNGKLEKQFDIRKFTLIVGVLFTIIGVLGFIPGINVGPHSNDPHLAVEASYGRLLGIFPVNALHNLLHFALGIWGILAAREALQSRTYCRFTAAFYGVLTVFGLIPNLNTMFGLVPIFSHDIWLHAVTAGGAFYFGYLREAIAAHGNGRGGWGTPAKVKSYYRWS